VTTRAPDRGLVRAITFDFGNTLVPVGRDDLEAVVRTMTERVVGRSGPFDKGAFGAAWAAERERQFAEEVPRMREVDLDVRVVRVLARMRGMTPPPPGVAWDDAAAARLSTSEEVEAALDDYSAAFVALIPPSAEVGPLLARLAGRYVLGICSNWPLAVTIDRYVAAAGWADRLSAVVVSQRVGAIKPDPRIFRAAEAALGTAPAGILHVGDDWAADVVGARRAGWRVAWLRNRPGDSPLPGSEPTDDLEPDLILDRLSDLEGALATLARAGGMEPADAPARAPGAHDDGGGG
jgi:FMN hydrolase / 5-amino-6-(5-phospho-D-ribitylamino)uracil phosphatase